MTPSRLRCVCLGGFLFIALRVAAENSSSGWLVHAWKSDDGLPNNKVTGLAQTADGYLWVANPSHLARFDGHHFENVRLENIASTLFQKPTALLASRAGGLWVGMDQGAVIYLNGERTKIFTNDLPAEYVQSLAEDTGGNLWIAFRDGNVCRIHDGKVTPFGSANGLPPRGQCSLAADSRGQIWCAKGNRLGQLDGERFVQVCALPENIAGLAAASGGGVWLASSSHLFRCDSGGKPQDCGAYAAGKAGQTPLLEDSTHAVWIAASGGGLFRYDGSAFESIPISHYYVLNLFEDREQNVWAGTEGGGLCRINARAIDLQGPESGLPSPIVQSLCEDTNGMLWAVTENSDVVCRSNGLWRPAPLPAGVPRGMTTCVASDSSGAIWIGTRSSRLDCWKAGQWKTFRHSDGLAGRTIPALLVSKSGDLWLAEDRPESVQRFRDGRFQTLRIPPNLRIIRALAEDNAGNIWAGSSAGILLRINGDTVEDETARTTGQPMSIRCLYTTDDGALWIGYAGDGLGLLKDGHFKRLSVEQGLLDSSISQIVADDRGWMWFGSDAGIFKARRQELEDVLANHAARVQCIGYGADENLPGLQGNFGHSPGASRDRAGRLWIPMLPALATVDPARTSENRVPANPLLTKVMIDDASVASYDDPLPLTNRIDLQKTSPPLRLPPGHHGLKFEFTALSFSAPENVRFRYKLDGVDNQWVGGGTERTANYPRLAAGNYVFHLAACNSSGIWTENKALFAFSIAPFLHETWWFRCLLLGLFTAAVIVVVRYISFRRLRSKLQKLEQQAALDKERARIARDIHDDLGGRLTEVQLLIGMAAAKNGEMEQISATVRHAGQSLDEIVWALNPRHDTLPNLMSYISGYAGRFLQAAGIRCRVDFPDNIPDYAVPPEARHNLYLTVKEALNNAARHSQATEVRLHASFADNSLVLVIEDNGQGFNGTGNDVGADGLHNMRHRMEETGGRFGIESRPDRGTRISLALPLKIL